MSLLPCAPHRWPRFSACVDALLALPDIDRERWLAALPAEDSDLLTPLRRLLHGLAAPDDDFLVRPQALEAVLQPGQRVASAAEPRCKAPTAPATLLGRASGPPLSIGIVRPTAESVGA